jgi:DNA polymerase III subunit delta
MKMNTESNKWILGLLREYDAKSKGMNAGGAPDGELLRELLLKIFLQ